MSKYLAQKPLTIFRPPRAHSLTAELDQLRVKIMRECAAAATLVAGHMAPAAPGVVRVLGQTFG